MHSACKHRYAFQWNDGTLPSCTHCGYPVTNYSPTRTMIEPSDSIRAGRYLVDIPYYTTILERINDTTSFNNLIGVYKNIQKHDPEVTLVGYKPTPMSLSNYRKKMKPKTIIKALDGHYDWRY